MLFVNSLEILSVLGEYTRELRTLKLINIQEEISRDCENVGWDDDDALPVTEHAKNAAMKFIYHLPENIVPPEITIELDGHFFFDWMKKKNHILSVGVLDNSLIYAYILGNNKQHGRLPFYDELPESLAKLLQKYFKQTCYF